MTSTAPLLVPLLSGGALAGIAFIAIAVFAVLAIMSLTRHIRRSNRPWQGEVDGGIPLEPTFGPDARRDADVTEPRR